MTRGCTRSAPGAMVSASVTCELAMGLDKGMQERGLVHGGVEAARASVDAGFFPHTFESRNALALFDRAYESIPLVRSNQNRRHRIKKQLDV